MGFIEAMHAPFFIYSQTYFKVTGMTHAKVSLVIGLALGLTWVGYWYVDHLGKMPFTRLVNIGGFLLIAMVGAFWFRPPVAVGIVLFALVDMIPSLIFVHSDTYINNQ